MLFQSTRGPEGPRDMYFSPRYGPCCFNPRAGPRDRATVELRGEVAVLHHVSIHARARGTARPVDQPPCGADQGCFNPRAGPRDRATPARQPECFPAPAFQSTRGPEGPRDEVEIRRAVSLMVSIHARARGTARHETTLYPRVPRTSFNPRAGPRDRATQFGPLPQQC